MALWEKPNNDTISVITAKDEGANVNNGTKVSRHKNNGHKLDERGKQVCRWKRAARERHETQQFINALRLFLNLNPIRFAGHKKVCPL
jgi:hypothetical protein